MTPSQPLSAAPTPGSTVFLSFDGAEPVPYLVPEDGLQQVALYIDGRTYVQLGAHGTNPIVYDYVDTMIQVIHVGGSATAIRAYRARADDRVVAVLVHETNGVVPADLVPLVRQRLGMPDTR